MSLAKIVLTRATEEARV